MKLLEQLTQIPGVAGREHRMRDFIRAHAKPHFDEMRVDALGSLICTRYARPAGRSASRSKTRNPKSRPLRIMLSSHMDQIGFMVRAIGTDGFIRLQNVGGFDTRNLFARLVTVCTDSGDLPGVLNPGGRPLHISSPEDRKKIPEIHDLVVDLGLPAENVQKKVQIGDMVVIQAPFSRIGGTVVAQALDNRIACWIALRTMQKLRRHACEIHCAFTVQEEVGCRGAGPAAASIDPDIAIALDTTLCVDTPDVPKDQSVTKQGAGAGLMVMDSSAITDLDLLQEFEKIARAKKIPAQRTILPRGGTDASTIQRKASGTRTMTLVCPTRYIHTITEMIHLDDLHACRDLLTAYLAQAGER
jgi:putative aminopeptidase FrvX